jgi:hypothetical protein
MKKNTMMLNSKSNTRACWLKYFCISPLAAITLEYMSYLRWAGLSCIMLAAISCEKPSAAGDNIIDVASAMANPTTLLASDYFQEIRYVPLETTDNSLIGKAPIIEIIGDNILVTTAQGPALLFEKATGKFIRNIGHIGNDPGGYRNGRCFVDENEDRLYFRGFGADLQIYNSAGNYLGNVKAPPAEDNKYPMTYNFLNKDTLLGYYWDLLEDRKNRLLFFEASGEALTILPNLKNGPWFQNEDVDMLHIFSGEEAVEMYGPGAIRVLSITFKDPDYAYFSSNDSPNSMFWHQGEKTFFKEAFTDTIFTVKGTTLIPERILNLGDYHWDYADRYVKSKDKNIYPTQFMESNDILFFRFITGLYTDSNRKLYNAVYNKKTGTVKVGMPKDGLKDDLSRFLPLQPLTVSTASGEFAGLISVDEIQAWFMKHGTSEVPADVQALKQLKEDDNPVVVLLK